MRQLAMMPKYVVSAPTPAFALGRAVPHCADDDRRMCPRAADHIANPGVAPARVRVARDHPGADAARRVVEPGLERGVGPGRRNRRAGGLRRDLAAGVLRTADERRLGPGADPGPVLRCRREPPAAGGDASDRDAERRGSAGGLAPAVGAAAPARSARGRAGAARTRLATR